MDLAPEIGPAAALMRDKVRAYVTYLWTTPPSLRDRLKGSTSSLTFQAIEAMKKYNEPAAEPVRFGRR